MTTQTQSPDATAVATEVTDAPDGMKIRVQPGTVEYPWAAVWVRGVEVQMDYNFETGRFLTSLPGASGCVDFTSEQLDALVTAIQECRRRVLALPDAMRDVVASGA